MIHVSLFDNALDNEPKPKEFPDWLSFATEIGPHNFSFHPEAKKKFAIPAFSPAEYPPGVTRAKDNAKCVHFGVLDIDHVTPEQLLEILQKVEGLNAFFYTTWSHSKHLEESGLWSSRICIEFSRPVSNREWKVVWARFAGHFGMVSDPSCKDSSRLYYGPFAPPGTEKDASFVIFQGKPLDIDALMAPGAPVPIMSSDKIPRDRLERLASKWKRSRDEWRSNMGTLLDRICKGEPFAEAGNVDNTVYMLAQDLAEAFPNAVPMSVAEHFAPSLSLMNYSGLYPIEKVADKIEKALHSKAEEVAAVLEAEITESKLRMRQAFAHIDPLRDWPYTEGEVVEIAARLNCSRDELQKRWLIQRGSQFYILGPGGKYSDPYSDRDIMNAVVRDLAPARSAGVELWAKGMTGETIRKGLATLMNEYGTVATSYILDMRAQEANYEPSTRLLTVAPCPLRALTPAYDHDVAAWLEILCRKQTPDVLNWLALATDLDSTCAALMFTGEKDTGKSLFAAGVSRLWTTAGPSKLSSAMSGFNTAMTSCPLIFGDEQLPTDWRGHGRTAELREFIAARSRPYNRKFQDETVMLGAIRLVIAGNNEDLLAIAENLSINDIDAIEDRFYHIKVNPDAAEFLKACNAESFVKEDKLARHALWLRDNYPIKRNGRFLIRSTDQSFYRALTTKSGIRSAVCQWLTGYVKDPRRIDMKNQYQVRIQSGKLLVTTKGLLDDWDLFVANESVPTTGRLAQAIAGLSAPERVNRAKPGGGAGMYRVIDTEHLIAWAEKTEFATEAEIRACLSVDTEARAGSRAAVSRMN